MGKALNKQQSNSDLTKTWVFGKTVPGWYVARWIWRQDYADHLKSLGYEVQRSIEKPTGA